MLNRYKDKTGLAWADRKVGAKAKANNKYAHLVTATSGAKGQWQYYTTNDPMGKADGWYDYDDAANDNAEGLCVRARLWPAFASA